MRVSQCCCGCSLKTGTLILLWLDLLNQASNVLRLAVSAGSSEVRFSFFDTALLGWGCILLVIIIYGLVGVEKHRPSYLLPYIGTYVFSIACMVIFTLFLWIGSLAMRDSIIAALSRRYTPSYSEKTYDADTVRRVYNDAVSTVTLIILICIAITYYFFSIVYSYYKQMQEEDKGIYNPTAGTGVVYAAPADQTKVYDSPPAYGQQAGAAPYPQQNVGYPPQPVAGYPQPVAGYPQPAAGYPQPAAGYPQPAAGYPNLPQNAGYPQQQYPEKQ